MKAFDWLQKVEKAFLEEERRGDVWGPKDSHRRVEGFGFYDSNSKELAKKLIFSLFLIVSSFLDCSFLGNI